MQRIDIGFGINGKGANTKLLASANDSQRNLTAIGNENLFEHQNGVLVSRANPYLGAALAGPSASPLREGERIEVRGFTMRGTHRLNPHPTLSLAKGQAKSR